MEGQRLITFLYLLLRDEMTAGGVESLVISVERTHHAQEEVGKSAVEYSNKHLLSYAEELAGRLK